MMAIPFAIPDENALNTRLILRLIEIHLERLEENRDLQASMEILVRLLFEEHERRSQLRLLLSLLPQTVTAANRRTRSESSCCEDPKLSAATSVYQSADEDCSQVGLVLRKIAVADHDKAAILKEESKDRNAKAECAEGETMFSWLVPVAGRTIWRAMPIICMVGWHLFVLNSM